MSDRSSSLFFSTLGSLDLKFLSSQTPDTTNCQKLAIFDRKEKIQYLYVTIPDVYYNDLTLLRFSTVCLTPKSKYSTFIVHLNHKKYTRKNSSKGRHFY